MRKILSESKERIQIGGVWALSLWILGIIPFSWPFITLPTIWLGKAVSIAFNLKTDFFYHSLTEQWASNSESLMLADFTKIVITGFLIYIVITLISKWIQANPTKTVPKSETETK